MKQIALDVGLRAPPTLDNFLPGPNVEALGHLRLWLGESGPQALRSPVPIYLWGQQGAGKTHLLTAVREQLRAQGARCGWLDAAQADGGSFAADWAVLLLDDAHQWTASQQQLAFQWFVLAHGQQMPILAAGRLPPTDLPLRDDLRTRLGWGHVFQLQVPSDAERRAVLRQAADSRGLFLGDDVMDYMLVRFSRDLGSLMEWLDRLDDYALQKKRAITIPLIKSMMHDV